jgi:hypothetical protein
MNKRNFDAAIIAPFDVPVDAGVTLAMNFASAVERARQERGTPTIAQLFDVAVEKSCKDLGRAAPDAAAVREFFLVGNGGLRLCAQSSPSPSAPSAR